MEKNRKIYEMNEAKTLNLPVFKEPLPGPPVLSMDQYYKFVMMNLKWARARKKLVNNDSWMVNVRFSLK